jgi:hypothetical protein
MGLSLRFEINHISGYIDCVFILVFGLDANNLFLIGNPGQQIGWARYGLVQRPLPMDRQTDSVSFILDEG